MGNFVDLSITGDKALQRKMKALPLKMQKKIMRQALRKVWRPVLALAKAYVPIFTGALESELQLKAIRAKRDFFGIQVRTPPRSILGIDADDEAYYPAIVELGDGDQRPPFGFMRGAFDQHEPRTVPMLSKLLAAALRRAFK